MSPQSGSSCKSLRDPLSPIVGPKLSERSKLSTAGQNILSPTTPCGSTKCRRRRERDAHKNSQHYQESDILESYYRSSPGDKVSDYEDIWNTTDQSNQSTWSPNDKLTSCRTPIERLMSPSDNLIIRNDKTDKLSYKEVSSPEFTSFKPVLEQRMPDSASIEETPMTKRPDLLSRVCE